MRWTTLGHAAWLAEAGGLRILFDPVLGDTLHGGIHVAHPPRRIDLDALAPDLIVVSHVHPDHFDVPSLAALARRWPDAPVLTADPLVVEACRALGFATAALVPAGKALELGRLRLVTTPSRSGIDEWGVILADRSGTVWNQVDSVLDAELVRAVRDGLAGLAASGRIDLGLVHGCPLREVEAVTAGDLAFPFAEWTRQLAAIVALGAPAIVPASAGFRHLAPFAWRDAHVFPVSDARFAADVAIAAPDVRVLPNTPGTVYTVADGAVDLARSTLATPLPAPPVAPWTPLAIPPLEDPALGGETADAIRAVVDPWIAAALIPAIGRSRPPLARPLRLVLEVVMPGDRDVHRFVVEGDAVRHERAADLEHDAIVQIAGSMLADVIAGRRHWGEPLLAGLLRGARRVATLPAFFPYWALPYRTSVERWVRHQVATSAGPDSARSTGIPRPSTSR